MSAHSINPAPCCLNTCDQRLLIDLNRIPLSLVNWSSKGSHNVNVVTPSTGTSYQSKIETEFVNRILNDNLYYCSPYTHNITFFFWVKV